MFSLDPDFPSMVFRFDGNEYTEQCGYTLPSASVPFAWLRPRLKPGYRHALEPALPLVR